MASSKHTILLTQTTQQNNSRTFKDFDSPTAALNNVIKMYEGRLRELNPGVSNISYDISDLFAYIDSLPDMAAMVFDGKTMQYDPKPKEWIKQQVYDLLKTQAAAAQAPPARRR